MHWLVHLTMRIDSEEFNSFRRMHPELIVAGVGAAVAVPSLLFRTCYIFDDVVQS